MLIDFLKLFKCSKKEMICILILFSIALLLRISYTFNSKIDGFNTNDGKVYNTMAENFLSGKGLITGLRHVRPPLFPLTIACFYKVFGKNLLLMRVFQCIISSLTCVIIYFLGRKVFSKMIGAIACFLSVFYSLFIYHNKYLLTETGYIFLLALLVLLLLNIRDNSNWLYLSVTGVIFGLANLQRPEMLFFPVVLLLWLLVKYGFKWKIVLRILSVISMVMLIVILPWILTNHRRYGQVIPVASHGGMLFYRGNNPNSLNNNYFKHADKSWNPEVIKRIAAFKWYERDKEYYKEGMKWIIGNPVQFVKNTSRKQKLFWRSIGIKNLMKPRGLSILNLFLLKTDKYLLILFLIGVVFSFKEWKKYTLLYMVILYYFFMKSLFVIPSIGRFRVPIMPFVILFSAYAIWFICKMLSKYSTLIKQKIGSLSI